MNVGVWDMETTNRCGIDGGVVGNMEGRGGLSVGVVDEVSQDGGVFLPDQDIGSSGVGVESNGVRAVYGENRVGVGG